MTVLDRTTESTQRLGRPDHRRPRRLRRRRSPTRSGPPRSAGSPTRATRRCWRTTTSCPRSRTSPTTSATRWRCRGSPPRPPRTPSCSAACTSWPRPPRSSSPEKTVLIPDQRAGCSLADSITADQLRAWKAEHPGAVVVSYVNTTAAVKAETDICCTSSNAVEVVASIPEDREVLFCPDQFLGAHVRRVTGRKNLHVWAGECHVHAGINGAELAAQARAHPDAELFVHPECGCATSALYLAGEGAVPADRVKILSTGGMLDAAARDQGAPGAGRHRGRHAAPVAPGRTRCRLPGGQRPGVLQVHEDDHPGGAAALPGRGRRRGARRPGDRAAGAAQRAAHDRDRAARRRRMTRACGGAAYWQQRADVVVVGTGVAGLTAALAAHRRGRRVVRAEQGRPRRATPTRRAGSPSCVPATPTTPSTPTSPTPSPPAAGCATRRR